MNILFCYYGDAAHDARCQEEIQCLKGIGDLHFASYGTYNDSKDFKSLWITKNQRDYRQFLHVCKKAILKTQPNVLFLHDNYCALLIKFARKHLPACKIVYDMSELFIGGHKPGYIGLISRWSLERWEYKYLRYTDVTIAANGERADIARGYFALTHRPIVFDNVHKINDVFNKDEYMNKYIALFEKSLFTVFYAGGLSMAKERSTYRLMRDVASLGEKYQLIIAGNKANNDNEYDAIIQKNGKSNNIHYVGYIPRKELRFLLQHADVNVVTFELNSINNIFCASGKQYEGFFEGVPLLASENPPLRRICEEYGVGVSTSDFRAGILQLENDIDGYRERVKQYTETIKYDERISKLKTDIISRLKSIGRN